MKLKFFSIIAFSVFLSFRLIATELQPWSGTQYDLDVRAASLLQQFQRLDAARGTVKRPEVDGFYYLSAHFVAKENVTAEVELSALDSRHRLFGLDALRLTGRYFWLNDVVGDSISLVTGLTVSKIFEAARANIATFDHGGIACEGHAAIGKELSCEQFWTSRAWGVFAVGIADAGWPWLRASLVWERNWWELHQLKIFAEGIRGFGNRRLHLHPSFQGYGAIHFQAIDVGMRYSFRMENNTLLSISYAYRVFGSNCPLNANFLKLEVCYPWSL